VSNIIKAPYGALLYKQLKSLSKIYGCGLSSFIFCRLIEERLLESYLNGKMDRCVFSFLCESFSKWLAV
jgi:hypothetical protein